MGEIRRAADFPVGIAGSRDKLSAFVFDADISALLRKGALEALGAQWDISRDISRAEAMS